LGWNYKGVAKQKKIQDSRFQEIHANRFLRKLPKIFARIKLREQIMKELDIEALSQFNGKDGKPAYIVYRGRVIDVSQSKLWKAGIHMKRHQAGNDLTGDVEAAPHGAEVLDRYPQVGVLKTEEVSERPMPKFLSGLLVRYPILRRHPHPMLVHFPVVFMYAAPLFNLLYLITGIPSFEVTSLHCLGGGILFTPLAILTGWFTWWLNYLAKPMRPVTIKIRFSILLMAVSISAFIWRIWDPGILISFTGRDIFYFLLILSLVPIVTVIGWFGAKMTFPLEGQ
jgi:predicted heme/steroid binding protein/uncharacterized membrane protein